MKTEFFGPEGEPVTSFTGENGLPYHDSFNGAMEKNTRQWKIIAVFSMCCFGGALIAAVQTARLPKSVPVIITVDGNGDANYVGKVDRSLYGKERIPESHKEAQIKKLINRMYTWVSDRSAQTGYINEAAGLVQGTAMNQLKNFYQGRNPYDHLGATTCSVTCEQPLKQNGNTYITYFTIRLIDKNGLEEKKQRYSILTTLGYFQSTPENPLGVYITNFDVKEVY